MTLKPRPFSRRITAIIVGMFLVALAFGAELNWRVIVALIGINIILQALLGAE